MAGTLLASGLVAVAAMAGVWWLQTREPTPAATPVSAPPPALEAPLASVVPDPGEPLPGEAPGPPHSDPAADAAFTQALLAAAAERETGPEAPAGASDALRPEKVVEFLEAHYDDPTEEGLRRRLLARDLLVAAGGRAVPALLEARRSADATFAVELQSIIGEMDSTAVPPLIEGLEHEDESVRQAAAKGLGTLGPEAAAAVEALIAAANTNNIALGASAVESLVQIGETAIPALVDALDDPDPALRWVPVYVLGRLGPMARPAARSLEPLLEDENEFVRHQTKIALESIGQAG